jgi:uncharacterized protein (DUF1810 family)
MNDPHNLQRFVDAQNPVFENALSELRKGRKISHWMWFVFPQIEGLGRSQTAREFAISSREEAKAYLLHPVLGPRLAECVRVTCLVEGRSAHEIFGAPDDAKFRSSMTLFAHVAAQNEIFRGALRKYFGGQSDRATLERL